MSVEHVGMLLQESPEKNSYLFNIQYNSSLLPPSMSAASHSLPYLPARQDVAGQLDLGEVSLADGLEQAVVADVRLLIWAGGDGVPASGAQWAAGLASGLVWAAGPQWYMLEEEGRGRLLAGRLAVDLQDCLNW